MVGLPDGVKTLICITVYTQYQSVTDRQTDILPWHSPRYAYTSRGKNYSKSKIQRAKTYVYSMQQENTCSRCFLTEGEVLTG